MHLMRKIIFPWLFLCFFLKGFVANAQPAQTVDYTDKNDKSVPLAYEYYIEKLNQETPLTLTYNSVVQEKIDDYLNNRRKDLEDILSRADYYFPVIESYLDKYNLPLELKYIAVIESGLHPSARSRSGAVGLWQFLYSTCSLFDLQVNSYIDERRDIYKSTDAACRYLIYLHNTFNDWNLVIASYNGGPGEVRKAIERSGGKTDYWQLRPYLSDQAANYVPSFIAMNYLMNYYPRHGIRKVQNNLLFSETDTLHIHYAVSFEQISAVLHIPVDILALLNPVYTKRYIPQLSVPCVLILPSDKIKEYLEKEDQILGYSVVRKDYNTLLAHAGDTDNMVPIVHIVQKGEYFHKIAVNYNCTVENIKAWNNLNSMELHPGQELIIWVKEDKHFK